MLYKVDINYQIFRFPPDAVIQITVMIKADGTDSKQVSSNPTSWSNIFFFFFPLEGFLTSRLIILAASEILKIIIAMISFIIIILTKLWVDV